MTQTPPPQSIASATAAAILAAGLGQAAATYAANKHRGGASGKKGSRYEDYFLAYKVAEIVSRRTVADAPWPRLVGQSQGFVDDVVINDAAATEHYQLKNAATITWLGGTHPIATDFAHQYVLAAYLQLPSPTTHLVVPSATLAATLAGDMPSAISVHSSVVQFPYSETLNRLVLENISLHTVLGNLARTRNPSKDELVGVLGVLVMACGEFPAGGGVDEIIGIANRYMPRQLKTVGVVAPVLLRTDFVKILARIGGLTYDVNQGFFAWSGFGTYGTLNFDCADERFDAFQLLVEQKQPMTFDGFEELLP